MNVTETVFKYCNMKMSIGKINIYIYIYIYIWSVLLYGCEAWTISKGERRRLEAFEMWCYRKLLKINWVDKVTNEEVLNLMKEKKSLYACIKKRYDRLIEHTLRLEGLAGTI